MNSVAGRFHPDQGLALDGGGTEEGLIVAGAPVAEVERAWRRHGTGLAAHVDATFVVWDPERREGVLARGRSGAMPVLLAERRDGLAFASDPPELLALLGERPPPDPAGVAGWLVRGAPPVGRTLMAGVRRLLPGHHLVLAPDGVRERTHWRPAPGAELLRDAGTAGTALREALVAAIARAAGPGSALLLSGGLDSTTVAALAPTPPLVLHAAFPDHPELDESAMVDETVAGLGLRGIRAQVRDGSPLAAAVSYTERWQAPLPTANEHVWTALLARAAQAGATVVLDGEGGDSVLGPAPYLVADLVRRGRIAAAHGTAATLVGADLAMRGLWRFGIVGAIGTGPHEAWRRLRGPRRYVPAWLRTEPAAALLVADRETAWRRGAGPRWFAHRSHELVELLDASGAHDLPRRRAAAAGLQARHPLLDPDLVELVLAIDPRLLHDPARDRPLARDALAGSVPGHVLARTQKAYFNRIQERWLLAERKATEALLADDARVAAYVDLEAVRSWAMDAPSAHPAGRLRWPLDLWRVLALELWLREHETPGTIRSLAASVGVNEQPAALTVLG